MTPAKARAVLWSAMHALYTRGRVDLAWAMTIGPTSSDPIADAWNACEDFDLLYDLANQLFDYNLYCDPADDHASAVRLAWRDDDASVRTGRVCDAFRRKLPAVTLQLLVEKHGWDPFGGDEMFASP